MEKRTIQLGGRPESESCFVGGGVSDVIVCGGLCDYVGQPLEKVPYHNVVVCSKKRISTITCMNL